MADQPRDSRLRESLAETYLQTPSPAGLMYAGWMMFWASIVIAAILLLGISVVVRRVDDSGDRDIKKVWVLVGLQYTCFLAGLFCFALNVIVLWLGISN